MRIITRTIYGARLQTDMLLNLPFEMIPHTTLNEKFGIEAGTSPQPGVMPSVRYIAIGNGGHRTITGADGIPYTTPRKHRATDAALFNHIPFVLREVNNDLPPAMRQRYALRREETHNGKAYYAYYLRRLNLEGVENNLQKTTVIDGSGTTVPFAPSLSNLNPTPPEDIPGGVTETSGEEISTSAIVDIVMDAIDAQELINVANVLYDNELMAVISEIALCSGVDRMITVPGVGGSSFNFNEAIAVQIASHITAYYSMAFSNQGFEFQMELGATEPLYGETSE